MGDIRVAYEYQAIPPEMTFVGVQNDEVLMPIRRVSGLAPIAAVGNLTSEELLDSLSGTEGKQVFEVRILAFVGIFVGLLFLKGSCCPLRVRLMLLFHF